MFVELIVVLSFLSLLFYLLLDKFRAAYNYFQAGGFIVAVLSVINLSLIIPPIWRAIDFNMYPELWAFVMRKYGLAFLPWSLLVILCLFLPLFNFIPLIRRSREYQFFLLFLFLHLIIFYCNFGYYPLYSIGWSTVIYETMNVTNVGLGLVVILLLNTAMARIEFDRKKN